MSECFSVHGQWKDGSFINTGECIYKRLPFGKGNTLQECKIGGLNDQNSFVLLGGGEGELLS